MPLYILTLTSLPSSLLFIIPYVFSFQTSHRVNLIHKRKTTFISKQHGREKCITFPVQFYSCKEWQCLSPVLLWFGKDSFGECQGSLHFLQRISCIPRKNSFSFKKGTSHCKLNECLQIKISVLIFMPTTQNQSVLNKISRSYMVHSAVLWKSFIPGWFEACLYLKTFNPFTGPGGSLSNVSFFCQLKIKNIICLSLSLLFLVLSGVSVESSFSFL